MIVPRRHKLRVLLLIASCCVPLGASAQPPDAEVKPSLAGVKTRVPVGGDVYLTDATGRTIKGKLVDVTDTAVQVKVAADVRTVAAGDVRRIQWNPRDSPWTGVLIGAAIGAAPGIYWLVADPNECSGMCPEEYALIGAGAAVGGVIDHFIRKKVTVYTAGASNDTARRISVGPLATRGRRGIQIAITF